MAEDARTIAGRRATEERLTQQQQETAAERQARLQAEAQAQQATAAANAARQQAADEHANAQQAQAEAAQAQAMADQTQKEAQAAAAEAIAAKQAQSISAQKQSRAELLAQLNGILPTRDTPRGLLVTVSDAQIDRGLADRFQRIATFLAAHPGLTLRVEGYTDDRGTDSECERRAQVVREQLLANGLPPDSVTAIGIGRDRPIASNATPMGREQNRRVEIVISGAAIGNMALWDRAYTIGQ